MEGQKLNTGYDPRATAAKMCADRDLKMPTQNFCGEKVLGVGLAPAKQPSEVEDQLKDLETAIDTLEKMYCLIGERLQCVLCPQVPQETSQAYKQRNSQLADRIQKSEARIRTLCEVANDTLCRLCI